MMIAKKLRIFVTRPMQFVIVNYETITLLWSFHAWSDHDDQKRATDDPRETFFECSASCSSKVIIWTTKCCVG